MSQRDQSNAPLPHVIEGELVRDWWEYEYDDLEGVGGVDLMRFVLDNLSPVRQEDDGPTRSKTYFGRVRVTIEVLDG